MNVRAHPMVVAVALGLLGPQALAEEERDGAEGCGPDARLACEGCDCGADAQAGADDVADDAMVRDALASMLD